MALKLRVTRSMKTILFVAVIFASLVSSSESNSGSDSYYYKAENYTGIELELQNFKFHE